ncbi:DUF305 domain-containing protein [Maricaulis sp. CAU 1757]
MMVTTGSDRTRPWGAAAAVSMAVLMVACGQDPSRPTGPGDGEAGASARIIQPGAPGEASRAISAEQSLALGQSRYVAADADFMRHMIVHHAQAVEMGQLAETRTDTERLLRMADRIARSQETEMAMMRTWLERRNEATAMPSHHSGHAMADMPEPAAPSETPLMPGMLSPADMARLAASQGVEFDRLYLRGMIRHHQGALDMVDALMAQPGAGEDPELSEFLSAVVADQSTEILRMRNMLADIG